VTSRATAANWTRRRFMVAASLAALPARAAQPKRLALLSISDDPELTGRMEALLASLRSRGWKEGERLVVLRRYLADWEIEGPAAAAKVVVAWRPDVIVTEGTRATKELLAQTRTIPVVASVADPIASGFARSLAGSGSNFAGLSQGSSEAAVKLLEIVVALVPALRRWAILHWDAPVPRAWASLHERAARGAGIEPVLVPLRDEREVAAALPGLRRRGIQAAHMFGLGDKAIEDVTAESIRLRLPFTGKGEHEVEQGLIACVDNDNAADLERLATLVDKILRGADPATMPVVFPDRFRTVINRRTAEAMGLRIPPNVLLRADRVIA